MARIGLIGPTYQSKSVNADAQRTMNLYPEMIESQTGKSAMVLYGTEGTSQFGRISNETASALEVFAFNGRFFSVCNQTLYEISNTGVSTARGAVGGPSSKAYMVASQTQLLISYAGALFVFTFLSNAFVAVNMAQFASGVAQVGFTDGYFVTWLTGTNTFQLSNLLDATTWSGLNINQISIFPDPIVSMKIAFRDIWFFGQKRSTVYYDTGNVNFPFLPIPGVFIQQGAGAQDATVELDNSVFWIGGDERGNAVAWRASGYTPTRVSNHAVEEKWQSYSTIADAVAFAYQKEGHSFWVITFPTANATWCYDAATSMWHERGSFNPATGLVGAHRSRGHAFVFGLHLTGDALGPNILSLSDTTYTDFGNIPIARMRRTPHVGKEKELLRHRRLQLDMETGLGSFNTDSNSIGKLILVDGLGIQWSVIITDVGVLTTATGAIGTPSNPIYLNDSSPGGPTTSWQLGITVGGVVRGVPVTFQQFPTPYAQLFPMASSATFLQTGLVVNNAGVVTPVAPTRASRGAVFNLRWSNDGGHIWSNYYPADCGQVGEYAKRVIWRRLGRARDRVYEITISDPVPIRIIDGYLDAEPGFQPQERLTDQLKKMA